MAEVGAVVVERAGGLREGEVTIALLVVISSV